LILPDGRPEPGEIWISEVPVDDDMGSPFNHVVVVFADPGPGFGFVLFRGHGTNQRRQLYFEEFLGTYNCTGAIEPDPDPSVGEVWRRRRPLAHGLFNEVDVIGTTLGPDGNYHRVRDRATGNVDHIPRERLIAEYEYVPDEHSALARVMGATSVEEIQVAMRPILEASNQVMGRLQQASESIATLRQLPQALMTRPDGELAWVSVGHMTMLDGSVQPIYSKESPGTTPDLIQAEVVLRGQVIGHVLIQEPPRDHPLVSPTQWERLREDD
jgi:hypothetical protein